MREDKNKQPIIVGFAQTIEALFRGGVALVPNDVQRLIEKYFLTLPPWNFVTAPVFLSIRFIPFKS